MCDRDCLCVCAAINEGYLPPRLARLTHFNEHPVRPFPFSSLICPIAGLTWCVYLCAGAEPEPPDRSGRGLQGRLDEVPGMSRPFRPYTSRVARGPFFAPSQSWRCSVCVPLTDLCLCCVMCAVYDRWSRTCSTPSCSTPATRPSGTPHRFDTQNSDPFSSPHPFSFKRSLAPSS